MYYLFALKVIDNPKVGTILTIIAKIILMKNLSNKFMIFLIAVGLAIVPAISMNSINSVNAQNQNQTTASSQNETMATITEKPQTTLANQTTIPAEQTTVTVNQTTKPMDESQIQPLGNQTLTAQPGNLSNLENKTILQPTGPATTIIANKTTVPFNQTTLGMGNMTN